MSAPGFALGLERDRERRWIAGVIGTLSLLATLALGLALSLSAAGSQWRSDFEGVLTVEIPAEDDAAKAAAKLAAALAVLRAEPAIERAEPLGPACARCSPRGSATRPPKPCRCPP